MAAALTLAALGATGAEPALGAGIVQLPVALQVKNTNTSQAPCTSGLPDA